MAEAFVGASIQSLDKVVILEIMSYMQPSDVLRMCRVPGFVMLCRDDNVARQLLRMHFPHFDETVEPWKQYKLIATGQGTTYKMDFAADDFGEFVAHPSLRLKTRYLYPENDSVQMQQWYANVVILGLPVAGEIWVGGRLTSPDEMPAVSQPTELMAFHSQEAAMDYAYNMYVEDVWEYMRSMFDGPDDEIFNQPDIHQTLVLLELDLQTWNDEDTQKTVLEVGSFIAWYRSYDAAGYYSLYFVRRMIRV